MGKRNKERRKEKKKRRLAQQKRKHENKNVKQRQGIAPVITRVPNPLSELSEEERYKAIEELTSNSEAKFQEALSKLQEALARHNPLLLLSIIASYGLTVSVSSDSGVDKLDSEFAIYPPHVELLQALSLKIKQSDLSTNICGPDVVETVWNALQDLTVSLNYQGLRPDAAELGDDEKAIALTQDTMRVATRMVRNWGYPSQVKRIARELYSTFDADLFASRGFAVTDLVDVFETLVRIVEERQSERLTMIGSLFRAARKDKHLLVEKYHKLIGLGEKEASEFIQNFNIEAVPYDALRSMFLSHQDLQLPEIYTFEPSDVSKRLNISPQQVTEILTEYSLTWGTLETYETDHIYLSNPVCTKPLIDLGNGQYFCVLPTSFFSFVIPCLENVLERVEAKISDRRAHYLEAKVAEILARRFPTAKTVRNLKWTEDGEVYETDLITFIDSFALIVECKSGKISAPALRGAPDRLKKHIQELIIDPNLQSQRLKNRLELLSASPEIADSIREELPHDLTCVREVVRVSVCLENVWVIQSSLKQLEATTWIPEGCKPCPTMNLADFETVFDILVHPVQVMHYFLRREALEQTFDYVADELDYLGLYLTTLLNIGDLEEDDFFDMTAMSAPIDNYYNSLDGGVELKKPTPKITPLFASIFSQLEEHRPDRWTEIGVALNMFPPDIQTNFCRKLTKLEKNVQKRWRVEGHKNMLICLPSKASQFSLACVMYKNENAGRRREFTERAAAIALKPVHVKQAVVIAKNIDRNDQAYNAAALVE